MSAGSSVDSGATRLVAAAGVLKVMMVDRVPRGMLK